MSLTVFHVVASTSVPSAVERIALNAGLPFRRLTRDELLTAAHEATTTSIVLVDEDVTLDAAALAAIARAEGSGSFAILGGRAHRASDDLFGSMVAPERFGPFGLTLAPMLTQPGERNIAGLFAGPIDIVARGVVTITRALFIKLEGYDPLLEAPYALADLCLRARAAGAEVRCDPTIVFSTGTEEQPPRRSFDALRMLAERHGAQARHHEPLGVRKRGISREVRLTGGVRMRIRKPVPEITLVVHGAPPQDREAFLTALRANDARPRRTIWAGDDVAPASGIEIVNDARLAVHDAMRVRGDRYVAIVAASEPLPGGWLDELIEGLEWGSDVAIAVARRTSPTARALVAMRLVPQHITIDVNQPLDRSFDDVAAQLVEMRRGVRSLDGTIAPVTPRAREVEPTVSVIFIAGSKPEIVRSSFEALLGQTAFAKEYLVVSPAGAETTRVLIGSYPGVRVIPDGIDPGLAAGLNAAFAAATGERIFVTSDEYLYSSDIVPALFTAFDRVPGLGLVAPRTNGGILPQGIDEISYVDLTEMQRYAAYRLAGFHRELTFIDRVSTVAFVVDRHVIASIGGVDERFGLNRFAMEDLSLRALAAGYRVAMCDDVFAHRHAVGYSQSPIGHADEDQTLWNAFRRKWSLPSGATSSFDAQPLIDRGFDPGVQFVALRDDADADRESSDHAAVFVGTVEDEQAWTAASDVMRAFFKAFDAKDPVVLVIGVGPDAPPLADLGYRLRKLLTAAEIDVERSMNINIVPLAEPAEFFASLPAGPRFVAFGARNDVFAELERVNDRSRAALRGLLASPANAR